VSPPNNTYAYRAYIEVLLNYVSLAKTSHLTSCLWDMEILDYIDDTLDLSNPNMALERRAQYIRENRALGLIGHCDVFNQNKFLINGVEVRMRFVRKIHFVLCRITRYKKYIFSFTHKKNKNKPGCATRIR